MPEGFLGNNGNGTSSITSNFPSTPTASFGATQSANASSALGAWLGSGTGTGDTTIINIQGNVQTQSDNVASIRQDLLQGILSGKATNFSIASI